MARKPNPNRKLPDRGKGKGRRANDAHPERVRFLIVCEGKKTEKNYFDQFKANVKVHGIEVEGLGANTLSVVDAALARVQQDRDAGKDEYDQVWCVFDRDSFAAERFNAAIKKAQQYGFHVAYSNEAFELWYWLHFDYQDTGVSRADYEAKLTKRLGLPYRKNDLKMYDRLLTRQPDAIRNAQTLLDSYGPAHNPEKDNPCTTVHLLVQELNQYAR